MGHIQRRGAKPNFRYRVRYIDDQGRERSQTFRLRGDAEVFLTSVSHQLLAGAYIDPAAGKVTVKGYGEQWRLNQVHLRPKSTQNLEQGFRVHVYPHLGNMPLSGIRPSHIAAWQRKLLKPTGPLGPTTVKRLHGQLSQMFKAAIVDRVINTNPVGAVKPPTAVTTEIVPLTVQDVQYIEEHITDRYRAVISIVAGSGLRFSECLGLTLDRVQFLQKRLRVDRQLAGREPGGAPIFGPPKTSKSDRTVPIADLTIAAINEHIRKYPVGEHGLLFTTSQGGAVGREVFGKAWRPVAEHVGLEKRQGLHQIRHFYASMLIAQGRSVTEVSKRLGHASAVETLDTYAHLWPDSEDGTRQAIEAVFVRPSQAVNAASRPS